MEPRPPRAAWAVAVVATLGMSVSYIDRQTLAAIAPTVTKALAINETEYGALLMAFSIAYLVGAPLAGVVVDRFGARRGFAIAVLVWSFVAASHALATSFVVLFALRILLGTAESPSFPSAAQAIRRSLPGARRPLAFGLLFTGSSIGAMVAGKLAVSLTTAHGFRFAFVGTALVGAIWIPVWLLVTRGAGLDAGSKTKEAVPPTPWLATATSPPVLRAMVAVVGSAPAIMLILNWTSKYLVRTWNMDQADVGNYLVVPPLVFDLGAVGFGYLATRRATAQPKTPTGLFLLATALATTIALTPLAPTRDVAIAIFAVAICGGGGIYVLVTADMLARVPVEKTSAAGGMTAAAQSLAHIVASPLVGAAIDRTHRYTEVLVALGLIVVPTSLAFLLWPGLRKD